MTRIPEAKRGGIYKRLETDAEYEARLRRDRKLQPHEMAKGVELDQIGDARDCQRRIVESSAD